MLHQYNLTPSLAQNNNGVGTVWSHSNISHYLGGTDHTDPDAYFAKYGYDMNQLFGLVQQYYGEMNKNVASLNNLSVSGNNLHISGWHAATESTIKPYSYIFIMDADTNREIQRVKVDRTRRDDVHNAYADVPNSINSGFSVDVPLTNSIIGHRIRIISRYTDDFRGNGNSVDYGFHKAIKVDKPIESAASLDSVAYVNGNLSVRGWFADNQSVGKPYRYLVALDATNNHELGRYQMATVPRPDVGTIYNGIANTGQSGFVANMSVNSGMLGRNVRFIARYSDTPNGNGSFVDHWFENITKIKDGTNQASLDDFKLTKDNLYVHGWHATDYAIGKPYSYILVLDALNNRELARFSFNRQTRLDVLNAYPDVFNAQESGFNLNIPISSNMKGKIVRIVSRYSDAPNGNGNTSDYFFTRNSVTIK